MNGKDKQNSVTRGAMTCLGVSLSFLEFPYLAALVTGVSVYQSFKNGSNPGQDIVSFSRDVLKGFKSVLDEEKSNIEFPVSALKGLSDNSFITLKKSGKTLKTDWINELAGKSNIGLLGDQGEGKSFLLRYFLYQFLRSHNFNLSKCRVFIHDIENGLGHGEQITPWLGLSDTYVYSDPDDFVSILQEIDKSIDRPDFTPTLLIVDEFNNTLDELSKTQLETVWSVLKSIRNRGKKRKIHMVFSTQDINVSDLGLSQAIIRKTDWVVYPKMSQSSANFTNFGLSPDAEKLRSSLATELKNIDRSGEIYPVLLYRDKTFSLVRIPDLSALPETLPVATELTPSEWWDMFSKEHGLDLSDYTSTRKLIDGVNDILRVKGDPLISRKNTDRRYCLLRGLKDGVNASSNVAPRVTDNGERHNRTGQHRETEPDTVSLDGSKSDEINLNQLLGNL